MQKLQLGCGVEVVAVFTHPITRCSTTAVDKVIASSGPVHHQQKFRLLLSLLKGNFPF